MAHEMFRINSSNDIIHCHDIEFELWSNISKFESEFFVRNFLSNKMEKLQKMESSFEDINNIKNKKITENKKLKDFIIFQKILTPDNINSDLLLRITNTTRQAREFYFASRDLPLLSKPILLMYTFEKLAELLALTIFDMNNTRKYSHGITLNNNNSLIAQPKVNGLFSIFHDCYSFFPDVYLNHYFFELKSLLRIDHITQYRDNSLTNYADIFDFLRSSQTGNYCLEIKEYGSKKNVNIHELDREFLFIYIISTLARYRVNEWNNILTAKDSDDVFKIQNYLNSIQLIFPNLILNYLFDTKFTFVPLSYFDRNDIEKIFDEKMNKTFRNLPY